MIHFLVVAQAASLNAMETRIDSEFSPLTKY